MQVGPYTVEGELGRGGAGVVLRGRAPDGAEVAIKVLLKADRATSADRFGRERTVHEELARSGGFVPMLDSGESPQGPYLVMPFLPGGTLRDRIGKDPWPAQEVVRLGRALARAMGRAHAAGVVHRDLKPENVLYDDRARPLIADLGLAKHRIDAAPMRSITQTGTMAGTLGFMPPEQMLDAKRAGPQADVFALGAILYECLTAAPAFPGSSPVEVANRMLTGGLTPIAELRPDAPRPLREVIERCLAAEPDERYADGAALATALLRVEGDAPRGAPRKGGAPALAIGLVVGALALGLAFAVGSKAPPAPAPRPDPPAPPVPRRPETPRTTRPAPDDRAPPPRADVEEPAPAAPTTSPAAETPAPEPARPAPGPSARRALATRIAGLGGLEPETSLGSDERRFVAPLRFLAASPVELLAVDAAGFVRGLEPADLRQRFSYRMTAATPTGFAASPDGEVIALATPGRIVVTPNGGELTPADVFRMNVDADAVVTTLALGADPDLLVFAAGHKIRVVDRAARKLVSSIDAHEADVTALALAGTRLVSADASGKVVTWRVGTRGADCAHERTIGTHGHPVACVALSSAGTHIASADVTGTWAQWEVATGAVQGRLSVPDGGAPLAVRFVGGDAAVWGAMERSVIHWKVGDPRSCERNPLGRPNGLAAFSPSGARMISSDPGGFILGVVDLEQSRELPPAPGHYAPVTGAAACDRGVYTIDVSGRALFWGRDGAMSPVHSTGLTTDEPDQAFGTIVATRDGRALAVGGERAFALDRSGTAPRELAERGLTCVTATTDGASFLGGTRTGEVLRLDPGGRVLERRATFEGRVLQVLGAGARTLALGVEGPRLVLLAYGPGIELREVVPGARPGALAWAAGGRAVLGTQSGELRSHGASATDRKVHVTSAHAGAVLALTSSPDGRVLLSAGDDDTLAAWRVADDGDLALIERCDLSATGDRIRSLTPLADGRVHLGTARGVSVLCRWR